jgi:hypothetical protein
MHAADLAFVTLAINPFGGLWFAIPFALYHLHYPVWYTLLLGVPLAYVQVAAVDLGWALLARLAWWHRFLERRRSPRIERLTQRRGAFWLTVLMAPLVGPWLLMAFMRYAQVPQRRVALPILLGLSWNGSAIALGFTYLPRLFHL